MNCDFCDSTATRVIGTRKEELRLCDVHYERLGKDLHIKSRIISFRVPLDVYAAVMGRAEKMNCSPHEYAKHALTQQLRKR